MRHYKIAFHFVASNGSTPYKVSSKRVPGQLVIGGLEGLKRLLVICEGDTTRRPLRDVAHYLADELCFRFRM